MGDLRYVKGLPEGIKQLFDENYANESDFGAEAAKRLVTDARMEGVYRSLSNQLGDEPNTAPYRLGLWFQMACACAAVVKSGLREKREKALEISKRAIRVLEEFNQLLVDASDVPEFWPRGLNIGTLLADAIDNRNAGISISETGAHQALLCDADKLKESLRQLHAGDERYFPTLQEIIDQFATKLWSGRDSKEIELTGYAEIDVGLASRKNNQVVTYLRSFCAQWDEHVEYSTLPKNLPAGEVFVAQILIALDLDDDPDRPLTSQAISTYLYDYRERKKP